MPFWRKKDEGFEWNKYVRTTVLVRRKKRRQKIEDVGAAAAFGVRQAKWKSIAHAKSAAKAVGRGSVVAGHAVHSGSKASWAYSWPRVQHLFRTVIHSTKRGFWASLATIQAATRSSWNGLCHAVTNTVWPALGSLGQKVSTLSAPAITHIAKPEVIGPLSIVAIITAVSAGANFMSSGLSSETLFITGLALCLIGLLVVAWPTGKPFFSALPKFSVPNFSHWRSMPRPSGMAVIVPVAMALIAGGTYAMTAGNGKLSWPTLPSVEVPAVPSIEISALNPFKSEVIQGRARAIDGGHLRLSKQVLRLDNIDALLPSQTCTTSRGRAWRCGRKAKDHLARLVRRRTLTCTVSGQDDDGVKTATCMSKDGDVSAGLVARGYAFAHLGTFANYREEEGQARQKKRGIWQGSAERPADYRMARWDKAVKTAPEGCPIKGRVVRRKRLYALPWDRGYARVKVRPRRGEKWFCTEQDARAAGFKRAS